MTEVRSEPGIQTYADVVEGVRRSVVEYCHAIDDGSLDGVVALFAPNGSVCLPGADEVAGRDALRKLYRTLVGLQGQRHLVLSTVLTSWENDRADALSDLVVAARRETGWAVSHVGRYEDSLRYLDGRWRFQHRSLSFFES